MVAKTKVRRSNKILKRILPKMTRYEVALPWKSGAKNMEDNQATTMARLGNLARRLSKDNDTLKWYDDIIRQYLVSNHREVVTETMEKGDN